MKNLFKFIISKEKIIKGIRKMFYMFMFQKIKNIKKEQGEKIKSIKKEQWEK